MINVFGFIMGNTAGCLLPSDTGQHVEIIYDNSLFEKCGDILDLFEIIKKNVDDRIGFMSFDGVYVYGYKNVKNGNYKKFDLFGHKKNLLQKFFQYDLNPFKPMRLKEELTNIPSKITENIHHLVFVPSGGSDIPYMPEAIIFAADPDVIEILYKGERSNRLMKPIIDDFIDKIEKMPYTELCVNHL